MTNAKVGQEVAVQSRYNSDSFMFGWTVAKITPTGQVVAKRTADGYEMRFDKDGYRMETSSSRYRCERLITDFDSVHETVRVAKAKSDAAQAVNAVKGNAARFNDKESLRRQIQELAVALEAARVAVEAI